MESIMGKKKPLTAAEVKLLNKLLNRLDPNQRDTVLREHFADLLDTLAAQEKENQFWCNHAQRMAARAQRRRASPEYEGLRDEVRRLWWQPKTEGQIYLILRGKHRSKNGEPIKKNDIKNILSRLRKQGRIGPHRKNR
jgi:hypothetical protein